MMAERKVNTLNRFDKLGYVLAGGVFSLLALLTVIELFLEYSIKWQAVGSRPIKHQLVAVSLQSILAAGSGYIWGRIKYHQNPPRKAKTWDDREQPWDYVIDKIRQEEVTIITKSGEEIQGVVSRFGSGNSVGDIAVGSPTRIERQHGQIQKEYQSGNEALISKDDIAQIHYEDDQYNIDDLSELEDADEDETDKDSEQGWIRGGIFSWWLGN